MHPETQRLLTVLRTAIQALGISIRELERRMGLSTGYLSRLLGGKVELRVDHVCAIARTLGLEPAEVFQAAFPRDATPPSPAARQIRAALRRLPPPPEESAASGPAAAFGEQSPEEIEQILEKTLRRLFRELGRDPSS